MLFILSCIAIILLIATNYRNTLKHEEEIQGFKKSLDHWCVSFWKCRDREDTLKNRVADLEAKKQYIAHIRNDVRIDELKRVQEVRRVLPPFVDDYIEERIKELSE